MVGYTPALSRWIIRQFILHKAMDINLYLQRINYNGSLAPNFETLCWLHRSHLLAIPYENLDIHLNRRIELNEAAFFNKLVLQKRGGWCFEMNGLFAWVLRELNFDVRLLAGSVRQEIQAETTDDHLVLLLQLERPYLVDVGFGDGFLEPLPLQEGEYRQASLTFALTKERERWVFHNHRYGGAERYDFTLAPYQLEQFAAKCYELQTSPSSGFVRTTVCQRFTPEGIVVLRGAVFKEINESGVTERIIETATDYRQTLADYFALDVGDVSNLWSKVWEAHQKWLQQPNALA